MQLPDMNLLPALDALLREGSVTGAAAQLSVSASAMSRTLSRLRRVVGDPLLVPAGRGLALTPRARELQPQVEAALVAALAALRPPPLADLAHVRRDFTLRSNDTVAIGLGPALVARIGRDAPGIGLRLLPEGDEDPGDLRDRIDLDVGSMPELPSDVRSRPLVSHTYVALARADAPCAAEALTVARFAAIPHITVSRRGVVHSVVDDLLAEQGHRRRVLATVPTVGAACFLALEASALALVPAAVAGRVTAAMAVPMTVLRIPLDLPPVHTAMAWHLRLDRDPVHAWLRDVVAEVAADG